MTRCRWCNPANARYVAYHDEEWGVSCREDAQLFELLVLECFQAGLSWETVLNKREAFRRAFDGFDAARIAAYDEAKIAGLLTDAGIIRHRRKIEAAVVNAGVYLRIQQEWGSFARYLWHFTQGRVLRETGVTRSALSDAVAADLKARGMTFLGSTTVYAYLQAAGVINAHEPDCFLFPR